MKIGHTIDANGYLTGDVLEDSEIMPQVTVICPDGFYKPKWNGSAWIEGLTQTEIDAIHSRPPHKTPDQKEIDKLKAEKEQLNLSIIEIWENIIPLLP